MIETETETDSGTEASQRPPRRKWPLFAIGLVLALVTGAAVVWGIQQRDDADQSRAVVIRQREAALAATGFVETLMSYDHEDLDTQQRAVEELATDDFRAEYADAFTADVREQIIDQEASSTVTVQDVFVTIDDDDELTAIVVAVSDVTSAIGASAEIESFLRIRLVRLEDMWKVDDLTSLGSRDRSVPLPTPDGGP